MPPGLLPPVEGERLRAELAGIERRFVEDGWEAAVRAIGPILGIDPVRQGREDGVELGSPLVEGRRAGFERFLSVDLAAARGDTLTRDAVAALAGGPVSVVAAAGAGTPAHVLDRRAAVELADLLGGPLVEFPGWRNGDLTHPRAFAKKIGEVLDRNALFR